ncbi:MAG TPA: ABC transporter ATP-binding protein [Stellaceae bacterium]|nr:ABC transporter ATP-binding protein [Stellaceae bacterium]
MSDNSAAREPIFRSLLTEPPPLIAIRGLSKTFATLQGERVEALVDIEVAIGAGSFATIVGPSGCGKSTLLRILAGLIPATAGAVEIAGKAVNGPRKDIGMVFQSSILLPWRTVLDNVMLPAEILGIPREEARERAHELLRMVRLDGFENKYPQELSGGMQQRASIARALLHDPAILLMDEPFGALDAMTREQMNLELQRIWQASGKTVILVTHSIPEAVFLGDQVLVMTPRPGRLACVIPVGLARPRALDDMTTPEFGAATHDIRKLLQQKGTLD